MLAGRAIKESEGRKKYGENVLKKRPEEASGHDDVSVLKKHPGTMM